MINLFKIGKFFKTYKSPIFAVILCWLCVFLLKTYTFDPVVGESKRLKEAVKQRDKENVKLTEKVTADSLEIVRKDKIILAAEAREQYWKNQQPKIELKYEKQKTDYIGKPLADRRRVFSKLANE